MNSDSRRYLDPEVLGEVEGLDLQARLVVEGYVSGLHRSPYRGFSVEFAEHREYVPGDDIRFLDWKVFGRSDRLYVKRFEDETNLETTVLLDVSESMTYRGEGARWSKLDYAKRAAAAIAWLVTEQQDAVGLALFDDHVRRRVPTGSSAAHLRVVLHELDTVEPVRGTGTGKALREVAESLRHRGLTVLFSDLIDDARSIADGLKRIRDRGHDMILFHVLDRDERTFPFERATRFVGLEAMPEVTADPEALRRAYLDELAAFERSIRRSCLANRIDYVPLDTKESLGTALSAYLSRRDARSRR